jgi:exonuclease SbcC
MIPVNLKIKGFLSYQDPVEIDFEGFDLACISGANGAGKSSLLDAITWALFGEARKRDDSIINSHSLEDGGAEVTLDFLYEGQLYRVQRGKRAGKPAMLDFFIQNAEQYWMPLSEHTLRDTEKHIRDTLRMDYETFINASFFLQGKADQFAQQTAGKRKEILGSILGLDSWEVYREATIARRKDREDEKMVLDSRLAEVEKELGEEEERKTRLETLQGEMENIGKLREKQDRLVKGLRKQADSLAEQKRLVDILKKRWDDAAAQQKAGAEKLEIRRAEQAGYLEIVNAAEQIEAEYKALLDTRQKLEELGKLADQFNQLQIQRGKPETALRVEEERISGEINRLEKERQEAAVQEESLPGLRKQLAQAEKDIAATRNLIAGREQLERQQEAVRQRSSDAKGENSGMKAKMDELKERIEKLGYAEGANCPLCGQPLSENERLKLIESLEKEGKQLGDNYRKNLEEIKDADAHARDLAAQLEENRRLDNVILAQQRKFDQLERQINQTEAEIKDWQSNGKPELEKISARLQKGDFALESRAQLAGIDEKISALGYNSDSHDHVRAEETRLRGSEKQYQLLERARAVLEPLEREIGGIQTEMSAQEAEIGRMEQEYNAAAEKYRQDTEGLPDLQSAENELKVLQEQENQKRIEVGGALQKVAVLDDQRKHKAELEDDRKALSKLIGQYKTLERAFSKDGIPALLIEQALPEIEQQANDILDRLTAGNMTVRFETQRDYANKKREDKRETLDIRISDSAGQRDYELFSGGEAFRVNFAIRLALSQVLARRAGAKLQTLVIDEGFGSQDAEGRQHMIEAINHVKPFFEKILVITHLEELKDAFPARIEVSKTDRGSRVTVLT